MKYKTQPRYIAVNVFGHHKEGQNQFQEGAIQFLMKLSFMKVITNISSETGLAKLSKITQLNCRSTLKSQADG